MHETFSGTHMNTNNTSSTTPSLIVLLLPHHSGLEPAVVPPYRVAGTVGDSGIYQLNGQEQWWGVPATARMVWLTANDVIHSCQDECGEDSGAQT